MKKLLAARILMISLATLTWGCSKTTAGLSLLHRAQSKAKDFSVVTTVQLEGVDSFRLFLNPDDKVVTPWLWTHNTWEETETHWFVRSLRPGDIVVDVGANIGFYTILGAKLVGEAGRVYAFEPDPVSFELLKRNVRLNGLDNVVLEQKAVSNEAGSIELFIAESNKGDHRIYQPAGEQRMAVKVAAVTLDGYFKGREKGVDFIKVDTQGAEVAIMQGMLDLVGHSEDLVMAFEYSPHHLAGFGSTGQELLDGLDAFSFAMFDLGWGGIGVNPIRPVTPAQLLQRFSPKHKFFTNLLLVKDRPDLIEQIGMQH